MKILPNIFGQGELLKKANRQRLWDNSRFNLHKAAGLLLPWECLLTVVYPGFGQSKFSLTFSNFLFFPFFLPPSSWTMHCCHCESLLQLHFFLLCFTGPNWKPLLILWNNMFGWILKFAAALCACTEEKPFTWFLIFPRPKITLQLPQPWRISLISELETKVKMKSVFQNI